MDSMCCFKCSKQFLTINSLISHIRNQHPYISRIICCYPNCDRKYNRLDSYKCHLHLHYKLVNSGNCPEKKANKENNTIASNEENNTLDCINNLNLISDSYIQLNVNNNVNNSETFIDIRSRVIKEIVKAYCNESIPRNKSLEIIRNMLNVFKSSLLLLKQKIDNYKDMSDIHDFIENLCDSITVTSEYKLIQEFKKSKFFVDVKYILLKREYQEVFNSGGEVILKNIEYSIAMLPLRQLFDIMFNKTLFLNEVISYINKLKTCDTNVMKNFIQSPLWRKKITEEINSNLTENVLYLPLFIYFDEFENANALGSHAGLQKLGGVYVKFPCIPEYLQSKLCQIFVAMLLFSEDRKKFGNAGIFNAFVDELNFLKTNGIEINSNISYQGRLLDKVKIVPTLILGDNLGLNMILGFSESFSSNFYCRFCKQHRNIMKYEINENDNMLRNPENYEIDLKINDYRLTGIKERSVWNNMGGFHVTNNYSVDVMHDLLEGVCHYVLIFILNRFITHYKFFTTEQLNYRMLVFDYGPIYSRNKPPLFTSDFLKKSKLKFSASEMLIFFKCFALIIGDLISDCEEWSLYLLLRQIVHIVCESDSHQSGTADHLHQLILEHNTLYIKLTKSTLKPKFHNLTHYSKILKQVGPLKHISSMRFESIHKVLKTICNSSNNKINVLKTIYTKYQIKLLDFMMNYNDIIDSRIEEGTSKVLPINSLTQYGIDSKDPLRTISYLQYDNIYVKVGMVVHIGTYEDDIPLFGLINHIYCTNKSYYLCVQRLLNHGFISHFHAFHIKYEDIFLAVDLKSLESNFTGYICSTKEDIKLIN